MHLENSKWIYAQRPEGRVGPEHYRLESEVLDTDAMAEGEVVVEMKYISVDPYMRIAQASRDNWEPPHPLNTLQGAGTVGIVVKSRHAGFNEGDYVVGYLGWQRYCKCHGMTLQKLNPAAAPVTTALGVLGMPGRTAWFGLMEAGKPKPGDVLVVSGAAGAVGSLVVQFGKLAGCTVVGIAGGEAKTRYLTTVLGADFAIDYKQHTTSESLSRAIREVVPGVDIYFDNVGGVITDTIIPMIRLRARIIICGQISQYSGHLDAPELAPRFLHHMLFQRATIQGILARDYTSRMPEMLQHVAPWVREGKIKYAETIIEGFEKLPDALNMLFDGGNIGKLIVKV